MSEALIPGGKSKHTPGPWSVSNRPHIEHGHPNVDQMQIVAGKRPITDGYVILPEDAALIAAAPDMLAALRAVNKLISEAAMTGFNCHDGDWAERLFHSQQATSQAIRKAEGRNHV